MSLFSGIVKGLKKITLKGTIKAVAVAGSAIATAGGSLVAAGVAAAAGIASAKNATANAKQEYQEQSAAALQKIENPGEVAVLPAGTSQLAKDVTGLASSPITTLVLLGVGAVLLIMLLRKR